MQQTKDPFGNVHQELFKEASEKELQKQMEKRFTILEEQGHTLERRVPITERQYNRVVMSKSQRKKKRKAQKLARRKNR